MYKAITSGHKYYLMKLLNIGEGNEDGEHDNVAVKAEHPRQAATGRPAQAQRTVTPQRQPTPQRPPELPAHLDEVPPVNGHAAPDPDGVAAIFDEPEPMTGQQRKQLHAIGNELYADGWTDKRHELVKAVTGGRTESSGNLARTEAQKLIDGMKKAQRQNEAKAAIPA
jgi:hypothetical protein